MKEDESGSFKVNQMQKGKTGSLGRYKAINYGSVSWIRVFFCELCILIFGSLPGLLGLGLRTIFYPWMFQKVGKKVVFGRNITIRHPHKIRIGSGCIFDDNSVIDAKGDSNEGIDFGEGCYIGRNTIVYCKNGDIRLRDRVNISANCQLFSSNDLEIGGGTVVGAFTYILSGGEYDPVSKIPFVDQSGMETKGPLRIGEDVWIAAHASVLDAASIGKNSVIGAGAVVNKEVPEGSIAVGVPAKVISTRK